MSAFLFSKFKYYNINDECTNDTVIYSVNQFICQLAMFWKFDYGLIIVKYDQYIKCNLIC